MAIPTADGASSFDQTTQHLDLSDVLSAILLADVWHGAGALVLSRHCHLVAGPDVADRHHLMMVAS